MGERYPTENFRFGTLWLLTLQPSLFFPGDQPQRQLNTELACQDTQNVNTVLFTSWSWAQNIHSSFSEKQPLLFSNFFCLCFILPGDRDHALMSPWCTNDVVVTFENFWLCSPGSWCHCPSFCIFSTRTKPSWSGNSYRWKFWTNWERKV